MIITLKRTVIFLALLFPVAAFPAIDSGKDFASKDDFVLDFNSVSNGLLAPADFKQARTLAQSQYKAALAKTDRDGHELSAAVDMYSLVLKLTTAPSEARASMKKMVGELEDKFGKNVYSLTYVLAAMGSLEKGADQVATFERALQIQRTVYPDDLVNYGGLARRMGFSYTYDTQRYGHALQMLGVALPVFEAELGKESLAVMYIQLARAYAYSGFDALTLASATNNKAFAIAQVFGDPELEADVRLEAGRGMAYVSDPTEALNYLYSALDRYEVLFGTDHLKVAVTRVAIAESLIFSKASDDAAGQLLKALQFLEDDPRYFDRKRHVLVLLVEAYEAIGKRDEATEYCLAISRITPWKETNDFQPVLKLAPEYPEGASLREEAGYVVVEYTVDVNGFVQDPVIVESTAPESFYETSLTASYGFRYAPRLEDGKPVETKGVRNKFTYKLAE